MAEEDKTYCGRDDRSHVDARDESQMDELSRKFGVSKQYILHVMRQVGNDYKKVEAYLRNNQNYY